MPTFKMNVQYNGNYFRGWEGNENSVRFYIEKALSKTLNQSINTICGGRTDAGVHGLGQTISFDLETKRSPKSIELGTNFFLENKECRVSSCQITPNYNSRFSPKYRTYRYYLIDSDNILLEKYCTKVKSINWNIIRKACPKLIGYYDISSFCPKNYEKRRMRTVYQVILKEEKFMDVKLYYIEVSAMGFAYHQVRYMVGSLLILGSGKQNLQEFKQNILDKKPLYLAPSTGLVLFHISDHPYAHPQETRQSIDIDPV